MSENQIIKSAKSSKIRSRKSTLVGSSYHYSGPLPHPSLLNQYDLSTRKTIAGFLTLSMIIAGVILLMIGKDIAGYASIFGPAFFQAGNYIYHKRQENEVKDNNEKKSLKTN
ncbi:MAG: hypothetical protein GW947_04115 [Candidatus Pacebacteria bacterium]|nr:hypothetical protein [Candidatus Paceibacterota bacterium]